MKSKKNEVIHNIQTYFFFNPETEHKGGSRNSLLPVLLVVVNEACRLQQQTRKGGFGSREIILNKRAFVPSYHALLHRLAFPIEQGFVSQGPFRVQHPFDLRDALSDKNVSDELKERALTKRVNAPDDTLYKDLVLIQSNKSTCRSTVNTN